MRLGYLMADARKLINYPHKHQTCCHRKWRQKNKKPSLKMGWEVEGSGKLNIFSFSCLRKIILNRKFLTHIANKFSSLFKTPNKTMLSYSHRHVHNTRIAFNFSHILIIALACQGRRHNCRQFFIFLSCFNANLFN